MNLKKTITSLALCGVLILGQVTPAFADSANVVTLGANLSEEQKKTMLDYFGVKKNEVVVLEVNNQEERKYLEGIASEQQIGTRTYSCAYVEPTKAGSGINVKSANITWVTSSMVATTLSTAGLTDANCVIASIFPVSGTGALTGVMKAFEDATGEKLDEEKKEIASEELIITGGLGNDVGQDKATGVINEIKTEIIKNDTKDTIQIAETIINVTNNYNITLTAEQQKQIEDLMVKISKQDYNYKDMKKTLTTVKNNVDESLKAAGEKIDSSFFESIGNWFTSVGDWFSNLFNSNDEDLGILGDTNESLLGEDAKVDSTDKNAIDLKPETSKEDGFLKKIWNWITGLFDSDETPKEDSLVVPEEKPKDNIEDNVGKNPEEKPESNIDKNEEAGKTETGSNNELPNNTDNNSNSGDELVPETIEQSNKETTN